MKITGKIELIKTAGRTDKFVKKQLPNDYFLALKITDIDSQPISTVASAFQALKPRLPSIKVGTEEINGLFETYKLAAEMTDVCHLSLAYFADFRIDRDLGKELDQAKVDTAYEELDGKIISFEIEGSPFQVVSTSKEHVKIETAADLVYVPVVGSGRDTILNLLPNKNTQKMLTEMLACVFGEGFKLWNSQKKEVPFHVTIAQTDKLNLRIDNLGLPPTRQANLLNNQFTHHTIQLETHILSCSTFGIRMAILDSDHKISLYDLFTQELLWSYQLHLPQNTHFDTLEILPTGEVFYMTSSCEPKDDYRNEYKVNIHTISQGKEIGGFTIIGHSSTIWISINKQNNSLIIHDGPRASYNIHGEQLQTANLTQDEDAFVTSYEEVQGYTDRLIPHISYRASCLGTFTNRVVFVQKHSKYKDSSYNSNDGDVDGFSIFVYYPDTKKTSKYALDCDYGRFRAGLNEFGEMLSTDTRLIFPVLNKQGNYLFHCISLVDHKIQVIKAPTSFVSDAGNRVEIDGNVLSILFYACYPHTESNPDDNFIHKWTVDLTTEVQRDDCLGMKDVKNLELQEGIVVGTFDNNNKSSIEIRNYNPQINNGQKLDQEAPAPQF